MGKTKNRTFEESLKRLQEISELLEKENTSLDDSIKLYEEGVKLSKFCYESLNSARIKITELKNNLESELNS